MFANIWIFMPKTMGKFLIDIIKKCLRFYIRVEFYVSSFESNFVFLLIKQIFLLNKISSEHQVLQKSILNQPSKTWFWIQYQHFYDFSNNSIPQKQIKINFNKTNYVLLNTQNVVKLVQNLNMQKVDFLITERCRSFDVYWVFIVYPTKKLNKVRNKTWNNAFHQSIISKYDIFIAWLRHILLMYNCKDTTKELH